MNRTAIRTRARSVDVSGAHLRFESHIKHSVGLVQHQIGDPSEVGCSALEVVNKPSWSGNDDFDTVPVKV
jgi:hypothetical protein